MEGVEVPSTSSSSAIESPDEPPAIQIDDTNRRNTTVARWEMRATEEPLPRNVNPAKRFVFSSVVFVLPNFYITERKAKLLAPCCASGRRVCFLGCANSQSQCISKQKVAPGLAEAGCSTARVGGTGWGDAGGFSRGEGASHNQK